MAWSMSFVQIIYRYLKHDEPSYIWQTNTLTMANQPSGGQVRHLYVFSPPDISMVTSSSMFDSISCDRRDLLNYTHTKPLVLYLILIKLSGLKNKQTNKTWWTYPAPPPTHPIFYVCFFFSLCKILIRNKNSHILLWNSINLDFE